MTAVSFSHINFIMHVYQIRNDCGDLHKSPFYTGHTTYGGRAAYKQSGCGDQYKVSLFLIYLAHLCLLCVRGDKAMLLSVCLSVCLSDPFTLWLHGMSASKRYQLDAYCFLAQCLALLCSVTWENAAQHCVVNTMVISRINCGLLWKVSSGLAIYFIFHLQPI